MTTLPYCHLHGKIRFPTYWAANRVRRLLNVKRCHSGGSVYRCPECHDWHLTHYNDVDECVPDHHRSKKQKRSYRLRMRKRKRKFKPFNLPLTHILIDMRRINIMQTGYSAERVSILLSHSAGMLKLYMGCWYNVTMVLMQEAEYQLRQTGYYARMVKKLHSLAMNAVQKFEHDMKHPQEGELKLFNMEGFNGEYREQFQKDLTDEEYFEFWQGLGGETWAKYKNYIMSMAYKWQRYLERVGARDAKVLSLVMATNEMLSFCAIGFQTVCDHEAASLPLMNMKVHRIFQALDPAPVQQAWHRMCQAIVGHLPDMTDTERNDVRLSIDSVSQYLIDPLIIKQLEIDTVRQYAEVFGNRAKQSKAIDDMTAMREEIRQEMLREIEEKRMKA